VFSWPAKFDLVALNTTIIPSGPLFGHSFAQGFYLDDLFWKAQGALQKVANWQLCRNVMPRSGPEVRQLPPPLEI
jgi:hypothetical protein